MTGRRRRPAVSGARRYDVIVVGARVAGAATAMLLARHGLRVLAVDRATFPSDTLSTHQIQLPGVARLRDWGILDRVAATGAPPTRRVRFDAGTVALDGSFLPYRGVDALYSPRRTVLDAILVDEARRAGAEVRENFIVQELVIDGGKVVGIRGYERGAAPVTETARLVVGADGKRSLVARQVGAPGYRQRDMGTFACYSYWSGLGMVGGQLYQRPGRAVAVFPTNDDLTMIFLEAPRSEFEAFRADAEGFFMAGMDLCGELGERVRAGARAERFRATPDLPNRFRRPCGPGWALVGDAGVVMDPVSAQGITNAFGDAELLTSAIVDTAGDGWRSAPAAMADYWRRRDAAIGPIYDLTIGLAALRPSTSLERQLVASLVGRPDEIDRFLGLFAGTISLQEYRRPRNMWRVLGARGLVRAAVGTACR